MRALRSLLFLNVLLVIGRLQSLPGLAIIGAINLPSAISALSSILWIPNLGKSKSLPLKIFALFLGFEGLRGLVGFYFDPSNKIVSNDAWQFHTFLLLLQFVMGITLPIIGLFSSAQGLRSISKLVIILVSYIGIYTALHAGRGPGGFMGDENDVAVALLALTPICLVGLKHLGSLAWRYLSIFALLAGGAGIVTSLSRGGMLGLGVALLYLLLSSKKKLKALFLILAIAICLSPVIPEKFWTELTSIRTDVGDNQGTVKKRKEMWSIAWEIFKDPRYTLVGIGLNNTPYRISEFETKALGPRNKTYAGRVIHSMYFQMLPETGLFGTFLFLSLFGVSFFRCHKIAGGKARRTRKKAKPLNAPPTKDETLNQAFAKACALSWAGFLASSVAVSVLYYPIPYFLIGLSWACIKFDKSLKNA